MTICFLVDTSTSMGKCFQEKEIKSIKSNGKEKCYSSPIDIARITLEEGLKVVGKHHPNRKVALFQTGNNIKCLSCGFGTPISIIEEKVKALVPQCSVDDTDIYTYPLSFIYNISNQYRIRNNTDRFLFGRSPFINEPLDIIIITGTLQGGINMTNISKYPCMGNDLSEGPSKWDHTVHLFVINTVETYTQVPPDLTEFILNTGGEVVHSRLETAVEDFKKLTNSIIATPFPAIKVTVSSSEAKQVNENSKQQNNQIFSECFMRLKVKGISGEWPIPEYIGKEVVPIRPTYPLLTIDSNSDHTKLLELAKQLEINYDTYEIISPEQSKLLSVFNSYQARGVKLHDISNSFISLPFAIIFREKNKLELTILPYNYNTLLPLIKTALDAKSKSHLIGNSWVQTWRAQLDDYVRKLPGYYYLPTSRMMKRLGLPFPNLEYNLNKNFIKRMKNMQEIASREIALLETAELKKWEHLPLDAVQIATGSTFLQRGLLESPYSVPLSTMLSESTKKTYNLLSSLETIKKLVYAGPQSLSCRGLSGDGVDGSGSFVQTNYKEQDDWFESATGLSVTRQSKIADAGRFLDVLARKEANRDPESFDNNNQDEENSVKGILKRKFSVNFGNRYSSKAKIKAHGPSSVEDGIAFDNQEFLVETPVPHQFHPAERLVIQRISDSNKIISKPEMTSETTKKALDGWIEGFSNKYNRIYWYNAGRNESVWIKPE